MSNPVIEQNSNLLQSAKFAISFSRIPNFTFYCQTATLPGIGVNDTPQSTTFVDIHRSGNKAYYNPWRATVLVDENMRSWFEIHNWVRGLTLATGFTTPNLSVPSLTTPTDRYSDGTLLVLNNANVPNIKVQMYDMFPSTFTDLQFDTRHGPDDVLTFGVNFWYTYYDPLQM